MFWIGVVVGVAATVVVAGVVFVGWAHYTGSALVGKDE